ncbi:DUF1778 domain-containing protein [bacterium]|nr:DUF1778 domain-containing protein [bacterium]
MATTITQLDFRLDRDLKRCIEKAAALRGQSVSAFAASVIVREANSILAEHATISLNACASQQFLDRLDQDIKPNRKLRKAARCYRELIR